MHLIKIVLNKLIASLDQPKTELTKAEMAALLEKKHLKECEENDYVMLEGLFQARSSIDDSSGSQYQVGMSSDYTNRYPLRRETAIELSPSKAPTEGVLLGGGSSDTSAGAESGGVNSSDNSAPGPSLLYTTKINRPWKRNASMEQQQSYAATSTGPPRATSGLLNPTNESTARLYKKSSESLQKNSSTETDYSVHPYRFMKQSSNETTTSMTGSYNVDTQSLAADLSLDVRDKPFSLPLTTQMYEGSCLDPEAKQSSIEFAPSTQVVQLPRAIIFKKQFGQLLQQRPQSPQSSKKDVESGITASGSGSGTSMASTAAAVSSKLLHSVMSTLKPPSKLEKIVAKEHSLSTDDSKDSGSFAEKPGVAAVMPQINTDLVQDEIAKLSSNIKSSTESEKDPPYNETMC